MSTHRHAPTLAVPIRFYVALALIILVWLAYTALDLLGPGDPPMAVLGFMSGVIGLVILRAAGFTCEECYLRAASISKAGLLALAGVLLLLIPILLFGTWLGWSWLAVLVYAPASGISQELFFRSTLLPALMKAFKPRVWLAVSAQAALFVVWHLRMFTQGAPLAPVASVLFLAGLGWGCQVQRDRAVVWAMAQHSLFLMGMALFAFGPAQSLAHDESARRFLRRHSP
jgi:membrane protease YdiL (CAAX protease family)